MPWRRPLLLTACGKTNAGSGSPRQHERKQRHILRTDPDSGMENRSGCGDRGPPIRTGQGKFELAAAAVLLDGEGKLESVLLDELEVSVSADSTGHVTLPTDWRTKRQKGTITRWPRSLP